MEWHKEDLDQDKVRQLSKNLKLDGLLSSILSRRGCGTEEDLLFFLERSERYLHNPFQLSEIYDAAERVLSSIEEGESVLIFGDRDVDGVSATVILYQGLLELGLAKEHLSYRNPTGDDGYGLSLQVVAEAKEQGISLILTADCGCANHQEIAAARELGVDVIVLDHHSPKEERPLAYALVNPHTPDEEGRDYPFPEICATSVSGKFLWALAYLKELGETASQGLCLLDIAEKSGEEPSIYVRAVKLQALCPKSELKLEVKNEADAQRLFYYIQNETLCSFTAESTRAALVQIYGKSSDIYLLDLFEELFRQFPSLAEHLRQRGALQDAAILRRELQQLSRLARYHKLDFFDSQVALLISLLSKKLELAPRILKQSIDMMALASIADMMPLQNENRIIVNQGLRRLCESPRPGLRELLLELGLLGQELSVKDLSWKVIPVLNAAGRMGKTALVTELLTAQSGEERRVLAQQLAQLNQERRTQSEKFLKLSQEPARKSFAESDGQLIYVAIPEFPRGITGLIAARLSQQYGGVPTVILGQNKMGQNDASWSGSLRSGGDPSILSLLNPLAEYFDNYGGHAAAGGFSISVDKQKKLWRALLSLLPLPKSAEEAVSRYDIDAEIPAELLNPNLLERLWAPLSPYGKEWPELLLLSRRLEIDEAQAIGPSEAGHLRLMLRQGASAAPPLNAIFWRSAERYGKDFTKGDIVDILYHIQANYYQGRMKFQLEIVDIRRSATSHEDKNE